MVKISTLRIIFEHYAELWFPFYFFFVDFEKAFDSVNKDCIASPLYKRDILEKRERHIMVEPAPTK